MGESDRYVEFRGRYQPGRIQFNINSPVVMLVIINFSIFLFVKFLSFGQITGDTSLVPFFYEKLNAFVIHTSFQQLLYHPWSIITYAFFHFSFMNILSNMLWLWCFGSILQTLAGNRHTIPVYLYGAAAGAIAFIAVLAIKGLPGAASFFYLYGANTAVMSVAMAATLVSPGFRILRQLGGGIPIWVLTLLYFLVDLAGMGTVDGPLSVAAMPFFAAHLAGALAGALYLFSLNRGYDWGAWMNRFYQWVMELFSPGKRTAPKIRSVKEKVFYNTGNRTPYHKTANLTQQRVDEILDKINQKGYKQLTEEEKNILKRASEEGI